MKATKDGKTIEISASGFRTLKTKGWVEVLEEVKNEASEGEGDDDADAEKDGEGGGDGEGEDYQGGKELDLDLPPADDEEKSEEQSEELPEWKEEDEELAELPEKIGTAHNKLIKEVKAKKEAPKAAKTKVVEKNRTRK